jgi:hypothetical protein
MAKTPVNKAMEKRMTPNGEATGKHQKHPVNTMASYQATSNEAAGKDLPFSCLGYDDGEDEARIHV